MFCECKEAEFKEFKEFWTRNGDHYCTLFFRPLRFLRTSIILNIFKLKLSDLLEV